MEEGDEGGGSDGTTALHVQRQEGARRQGAKPLRGGGDGQSR